MTGQHHIPAGAGRPKKAPPAGVASPPEKEARDTVEGCRERAAQDLLQAAGSDTGNGRQKFERSASSWTARADQIESAELGSAAQRAADRALWAKEEE